MKEIIILLTSIAVSLGALTTREKIFCVDFKYEPRNERQAIAYRLAYLAGHDEIPTDKQGRRLNESTTDEICFKTFDPKGIIDKRKMEDKSQQEKDYRDSVTRQDEPNKEPHEEPLPDPQPIEP